jgi:hypothetical protein
MWSRRLSLNLGGDDSYYRDGSRGVEVFLPVSEKDFYSTRPVSVITCISSQCQRKTSIPHDPYL